MTNEFITPVKPAPVTVARPRPFSTYYYKKTNAVTHEWDRIGRARTRSNAVRAAVIKVFEGEYLHVDIYDEDGIRCAIIQKKGRRISIVAV